MAKKVNKVAEIHRVSASKLAIHLKRLNHTRLARARQNYLISKSILLRRRAEILQKIKEGGDTAKLERMAARLEKSMLAHKRQMELLDSTDSGS